MTSPHSLPTRSSPELTQPVRAHLAAAERELQAFVAAVAKLYGRAAAESAAQWWVEAAERVVPSSPESCVRWRRLTIEASSRLASDDLRRIKLKTTQRDPLPANQIAAQWTDLPLITHRLQPDLDF